MIRRSTRRPCCATSPHAGFREPHRPYRLPMRMLAAGANYKEPAQRHFRPPLPPALVVRPSWLATQDFEGDYIVSGQLREANRMASWSLASGVSTNIDALYGQAGGRSYVERHADGDQPAGRPDALPLGRADTLAAGESPRRTLAQRRIYVQLPLHAAAGSNPPPDRPSCRRPAAAAQLHAGPKSGSATDRRTLSHAALSDTRSKHLVLLDASVRWKVGQRWELWAAATNLLNETGTPTRFFDGLSSSTCRYAIRPCNLLLGRAGDSEKGACRVRSICALPDYGPG